MAASSSLSSVDHLRVANTTWKTVDMAKITVLKKVYLISISCDFLDEAANLKEKVKKAEVNEGSKLVIGRSCDGQRRLV